MRYACQLVLIVFTIASIGCAMGQGTFDDHFAAYGGQRDRLDRVHGRVGSVLDPAASLEAVPASDEPVADNDFFDVPPGELAGEIDDRVGDEPYEDSLSDELRAAIKNAQGSLRPVRQGAM